MPKKLSCNKLSPYRLSVAVSTLYFPVPCCRRFENRKFFTYNSVLNNPTENVTLDCARTLSEASWLSVLEHLPYSSEVFHSHSNRCCQQGTPNLVEVGLSLLPSLKTYI